MKYRKLHRSCLPHNKSRNPSGCPAFVVRSPCRRSDMGILVRDSVLRVYDTSRIGLTLCMDAQSREVVCAKMDQTE